MAGYGLDFISDEDLFAHVQETVSKYRFKIDLKTFNKNLILSFGRYEGFEDLDIA